MKPKRIFKKWTINEISKVRLTIERLGNTKEAVDELCLRMPHLTKRQIQNKVFVLFGNRADKGNKTDYAKKTHPMEVEEINWENETRKSFQATARSHGAEYIDGVLMKDGKRVTWGQIVGNNPH